MKPTMEILTKLQENSKKNHEEVFTRLFRYMLRPDIYFIAYQHLYANKGAGTKGVNDDTADGFSEEYVTRIIEALRTESYRPTLYAVPISKRQMAKCARWVCPPLRTNWYRKSCG